MDVWKCHLSQLWRKKRYQAGGGGMGSDNLFHAHGVQSLGGDIIFKYVFLRLDLEESVT